MRRDGKFDLIGDAFEVDIYGSSKGAIRMAVLWNDHLTGIPRLRDGGLASWTPEVAPDTSRSV